MTTTIRAAAEHPLNRNLFIADNLGLLRRLDNESIDLICIDPPFAKNQTFIGRIRPPLTAEERALELADLAGWGINSPREAEAAGIDWPDVDNTARFRDIWRWESDIHEEWITAIEANRPGLASVIEMARRIHSEGQAAYLSYMTIRLIEMHRILKPGGGIYLHSDQAASPYLRMVMDGIFGPDKFLADIIWRRTSAHSDSKRYGNVRDNILFYGTEVMNMDAVRVPLDPDYIRSHYRFQDQRGAYRDSDLTAPGTTGEESGQPWREYDPNAIERHWAAPRTGRYANWIDANVIPGYRAIDSVLARLDALADADMLHYTPSGRIPSLKRYLDANPGQVLGNVWTDIPPINSQARERTGYPTQKPVALAERIILASTNPGDVVLDCFAGCAYIPVAAERNGRQWIACDISPRALTVLRRQFAKFRYAVDGEQRTTEPALITDSNVITRSPFDLPERTDEDPDPAPEIQPLPERVFKVPASLIPEGEMLTRLLELSDYKAWCCGYANRMPDGSIIRTTRNFHLDHIDPRSRDGSNDIQNRAPLCPYHNIRKRNRRIHLDDYRKEIADSGEMMVNSANELINLAYAQHEAMLIYGRAFAARYPSES